MNGPDAMANTSRWRRRLLVGGVILLGVVAVTTVGMFLSLQYIPQWYAPPKLTDDDLPRIRASLPAAFEDFSRRLVAGKPFKFTLAAKTINEWIASRNAIWPDAYNALPPNVQEPVIWFDNELVTIGATVVDGSLRAVVSFGISVGVSVDTIELFAENTVVGSLTLPVDWLTTVVDLPAADELELAMARLKDTVQLIDDEATDRSVTQRLLKGVRVKNRFRWPNGKRWFRIQSIGMEAGQLTLAIQPL